MALMFLVAMAIMQMGFCDPIPNPDADPDPGNDIQIDIKQIVNVDGCCPENRPHPRTCTYNWQEGICSKVPEPPFVVDVGVQECEDGCNCYIEGCKFGDDVYPDGAKAKGTCITLECVDGIWNYTGKINHDCGECQLFGDPHIFTFDDHTGQHPPHYYEYHEPGIFIVTQGGLNTPAEYGLSAYMEACWEEYDPNTHNYYWSTCVRGINYFEPDIEINVTLPSWNSYDDCYPYKYEYYSTTFSPFHNPACLPKTYVNGAAFTFGNSMESFNTNGGTVLLFPHNHQGVGWDKDSEWFDGNTICINIVGSTGLSVSLCMSYSGWYSNLYLLAAPTLRGELYGLCDTYTDGVRPGYMMQNGSLTTDNVASGDTWKTHENEHSGGLPNLDKCTNTTVLAEIEARCEDIIEPICVIVPFWQCEGFLAGCVYDLCRSTHPDQYVNAFKEHLHIHSLLA